MEPPAEPFHEAPVSQHLYYLALVGGYANKAELQEAALKELLAAGKKFYETRSLTSFIPPKVHETLFNLNYREEDALQPLKFQFITVVISQLKSSLSKAEKETERDQCVEIFKGVIGPVVEAAVVGVNNREHTMLGLAALMALEQDFMRSSKHYTKSNILFMIDQVGHRFATLDNPLNSPPLSQEYKDKGKRLCREALTQIVDAFCLYPKDLPHLDIHAIAIAGKLQELGGQYHENMLPEVQKLEALIER